VKLGDFSDYVKADRRKYFPVVYSKNEMKRLFARMRGKWLLMARLQYGCGLRVSELCRLRVKDIDLERGKLYIRASKGDRVKDFVSRDNYSSFRRSCSTYMSYSLN
jgi:integrase